MNEYDFSLAKESDIPKILKLYRSLIGTSGCTWSIDYPDAEIVKFDVKNDSLYILKENGVIIAVASAGLTDELNHLQWSLEKPCELARIGVRATLQKRGIGTIILKNVIEAVKERDFDGIIMLVSKTNPSALALYDKNGFERLSEVMMYGINFYCYQMKF